jgi:4-alpha-glucanotransferase
MTAPVTLLFGVHAHQPAGNFPEVIATAHERCYRPFLQVMARVPEFPFAFHTSGPLLEFLAERYPEDVALLGTMVARGQVELFGAGDTEPVLASIPERDRLSQLDALATRLQRRFGARPGGAWLTERVWESTVVPALAASGIRYVTVDDYHFLCAGQDEASLAGYFTTEEGGYTLDLYPISEALRYAIPFAPAEEAAARIAAFADRGPDAAAIYFDDIEKFGIWPETYEWVYEKGWLEAFLRAVLASPQIRVSTFREHHARARTRGIVYLPTTSYIEMNEWTLPAPAAASYAALVAREKEAGRYASDRAFVRGGIWKNFLTRYPEANRMHKRMIGLSVRLARLMPDRRTPVMRYWLHLAQANDAYWHGLFGGLYLPHLRRGVYSALLRLERLLDEAAPRAAREQGDFDADGHEEVWLHSADVQAIVSLDGSATVVELDGYALAQNFGDTLRRHAEHYHAQALAGMQGEHAGAGIASAHDRVSFKHPITAEDLAVDTHARTMFRDHWNERVLDGYVAEAAASDALEQRFVAPLGAGRVEKRIALDGDTLRVRYRFVEQGTGFFRTEVNVAMPSCDGYSGRYIVGERIPCGFGQALEEAALGAIALDDRFMRGALAITVDPPAFLRAGPTTTVSQSEDGFEKIMQCATLAFEWPLRPEGQELAITLRIVPDAGDA